MMIIITVIAITMRHFLLIHSIWLFTYIASLQIQTMNVLNGCSWMGLRVKII